LSERVLVAVDDRAVSRRALRRGAMIASAMGASLVAAVIVTPEVARLPFDRERDLRENVAYADDLGAELVRYEAPDLVAGLVDVATSRRVTHIVLPRQELRGLARLRSVSPADALLERLPEIEVHLIGTGPAHRSDSGGKPASTM
jgi:two-component system sensor histidine kinase KdpD